MELKYAGHGGTVVFNGIVYEMREWSIVTIPDDIGDTVAEFNRRHRLWRRRERLQSAWNAVFGGMVCGCFVAGFIRLWFGK